MVNRKAREAKRSLKTKAFGAAGAALGGPGGAIAVKAGERVTRRNRGHDDEVETTSTGFRPEGRGLNNRRQQALAQARAEARTNRTEPLGHEADRDARISGIAASAGRNLDRSKKTLGDKDTERAVTSGAAAWKRLDKDEAKNRRRERHARTELLTANVGQRWDGGDRSAIAPMKVYTPARPRESAHATSTGTSSRESRNAVLRGERSTGSMPSRPRVWNAPTPDGPFPRDRYL